MMIMLKNRNTMESADNHQLAYAPTSSQTSALDLLTEYELFGRSQHGQRHSDLVLISLAVSPFEEWTREEDCRSQ